MKLTDFGHQGGSSRPKFYYVDPPLQRHVKEAVKLMKIIMN